MLDHLPSYTVAYHSCDQELGLQIINGKAELKPSENRWDWLGHGIYLWEGNPLRALQYAEESSKGLQFNKKKIKTPFVLGVLVDMGNCLNLIDASAMAFLKDAFVSLDAIFKLEKTPLPTNNGNNRILDCAVITMLHQSRIENKLTAFDTIRGAFPEGENVYPGSAIKERTHLQICIRNDDCIKGYFLPRPSSLFNPQL